jgi:5-methylthioribose kinase
MTEITADNALAFLREKGWIGLGKARVEALGGGVSNVVLRVTTPERAFVVKQSRSQLRTRDAWFSDLERIHREQEVMEALRPLLPAGTVPEVLFVDRANYVFAMSHAPEDSRVWKSVLLAGEIDPAVGELAGRLLGRMHDATARMPELAERFGDHRCFVQLRVDPFYRKVHARRPEVADAIGEVIDRMLSCRGAICHGDYTPKNLLLHAGGFTLVDYECAHYGDPTMDLGLLLAHLVLKAMRLPDRAEEYLELTQSFWRGYKRFRADEALEARAVSHFAVCLLARIDGTSPVEYLPDEGKREAVRRLARTLLTASAVAWADALETVRGELNTNL